MSDPFVGLFVFGIGALLMLAVGLPIAVHLISGWLAERGAKRRAKK